MRAFLFLSIIFSILLFQQENCLSAIIHFKTSLKKMNENVSISNTEGDLLSDDASKYGEILNDVEEEYKLTDIQNIAIPENSFNHKLNKKNDSHVRHADPIIDESRNINSFQYKLNKKHDFHARNADSIIQEYQNLNHFHSHSATIINESKNLLTGDASGDSEIADDVEKDYKPAGTQNRVVLENSLYHKSNKKNYSHARHAHSIITESQNLLNGDASDKGFDDAENNDVIEEDYASADTQTRVVTEHLFYHRSNQKNDSRARLADSIISESHNSLKNKQIDEYEKSTVRDSFTDSFTDLYDDRSEYNEPQTVSLKKLKLAADDDTGYTSKLPESVTVYYEPTTSSNDEFTTNLNIHRFAEKIDRKYKEKEIEQEEDVDCESGNGNCRECSDVSEHCHYDRGAEKCFYSVYTHDNFVYECTERWFPKEPFTTLYICVFFLLVFSLGFGIYFGCTYYINAYIIEAVPRAEVDRLRTQVHMMRGRY